MVPNFWNFHFFYFTISSYNRGMSSKRPTISIIIPFFNTASPLTGLIDQVEKSCKVSHEIICVDDKSTDDSLAKIKKLSKKYKNLRVFAQPKNSGSAAARNRGLDEATGKYIVFLDSDDFIREDYFDKMLEAIEDDNIALASCGIRQIFLKNQKVVDKSCTEQPERKKNEGFREFILRSMIKSAMLYSSVNKIYRGDVIRKNKLRFDEKLDFAEDTKFVLGYLACFDDDTKIEYITEPLYFYNYGTSTSVVSNSALDWKNWQKSYTDILDWLGREQDGTPRVASHKEYKLAKNLRKRFKISHALAVARSKKSHEEKLKYAGKFELFVAETIEKIKK